MDFIEDIKQILKSAVKKLYGKEVEPFVEQPTHSEHGDFASNIALILAREIGENPLEVAEKLVDYTETPEYISKVIPIHPGFINFCIDEDFLAKQTLDKVFSDTLIKKVEGHEKVIVEHTSVNPNKAMHVGHIRNAILGDSISNLLKRVGYKVEVQNYIDDTGVQVVDTVNAILNLKVPQPSNQKFDDYCWDIYAQINQEYAKENTELLGKRKKILHEIESGEGEIAKKSVGIVDKILDCQIDVMEDFGIYYDLLVHESDIIARGFWEVAFEQLKDSPNMEYVTQGDKKGCWVLKFAGKEYDDKILVRSDGTKVYTAKDIAYHMWKFGVLGKDFLYEDYRKFQTPDGEKCTYKTYTTKGQPEDKFGNGSRVINLIDERQTYPQEMVKHALQSLGFTKQAENYNHVAYGVVSLSRDTAKALGVDVSDNRASYAMSGRKGIGVKVTDLLDLLTKEVEKVQNDSKVDLSHSDLVPPKDIAAGAIKHYMLKSNPFTAILFDYKQALQLVGNTGSYLQYSHARASGILEKVEGYRKTFGKEKALTETEVSLIKQLANWPYVVEKALEDFNMSTIAEYAFMLSKEFHAFYEKNIVLKSEGNTRDFRLTLIAAYAVVIKDVLGVLGIVAPKKM